MTKSTRCSEQISRMRPCYDYDDFQYYYFGYLKCISRAVINIAVEVAVG